MGLLPKIYLLCIGGFLLPYLEAVKTQLNCTFCDDQAEDAVKDVGTISEGLHLYPPRNTSNANQVFESSIGDVPTANNTCPYSSADARELLGAIEKMVKSFYVKNVEKITMRSDASIGLGVLKNQLAYLLEAQAKKLSPELRDLFDQLRELSGKIALQILEQESRAEKNRSRRKGICSIRKNVKIVKGLGTWKEHDAIKKHFEEFKNIGNEQDVYCINLSFQCQVSMIKDCDVPQVCKETFLTDIYSQTMLTRQVMYQQFAEKRGCATINPKPFKNAKLYQDRLCSKVYLEAEYLASHYFPTKFIDLFAEQVGYCGLLGYPNFMRADWLREILSWRSGSVSGCIPNLYGSLKTADDIIEVPVEGYGGESKEKCLVHLSSMGLMALSMHLRYLVDICPTELLNGYIKPQ